jgi:EAL domain-containing protein (putative c-di-GMP-specific phosphodiesterase class I)
MFFETAMGEVVSERFQLEAELRVAIAENQLRLYLQPQVDAAGVQVGAEALVRWQHPARGLIPPGLFIPLAEASDMIVALDRWMRKAARCGCRSISVRVISSSPILLTRSNVNCASAVPTPAIWCWS